MTNMLTSMPVIQYFFLLPVKDIQCCYSVTQNFAYCSRFSNILLSVKKSIAPKYSEIFCRVGSVISGKITNTWFLI